MSLPPSTDQYLRINEIKNYIYCPRIAFYTLVLRFDRQTGLSRLGIAAEAETKQRMKRRKHALHAVVAGERRFDVQVVSHQYRLVGRLDEVVRTDAGMYLVDYKDTDRDYGYWQVQMQAYRLALTEQSAQPVLGAYVYSIPSQVYHEVKTERRHQARLEAILAELAQMIESERCPPAVDQVGKCRGCQYARFCNDVF